MDSPRPVGELILQKIHVFPLRAGEDGSRVISETKNPSRFKIYRATDQELPALAQEPVKCIKHWNPMSKAARLGSLDLLVSPSNRRVISASPAMERLDLTDALDPRSHRAELLVGFVGRKLAQGEGAKPVLLIVDEELLAQKVGVDTLEESMAARKGIRMHPRFGAQAAVTEEAGVELELSDPEVYSDQELFEFDE